MLEKCQNAVLSASLEPSFMLTASLMHNDFEAGTSAGDYQVNVTGTRVGSRRRCCCRQTFILYGVELCRLPYRRGEAIEVSTDARGGGTWVAGKVMKVMTNKVHTDGVYTISIGEGKQGELKGVPGRRLRLPGGDVRQGEVWSVEKRYSDFIAFDSKLRRTFAKGAMPPLPKRMLKGLRDHKDPSFRYQRQAAFHFYLERVLTLHNIERNGCFLQFFNIQPAETDRLVAWTAPSAMSSIQ